MDSKVNDHLQPDVAESITTVIGAEGADEANQLVLAAEQDALGIPADFVITDAGSYASSDTLLAAIRSRTKTLNETRLGITRPMDDSKKRVMEFFQRPLDKLKAADTILANAMLAWNKQEEARIAKEQAEADAAAEKERQKLEKKADRAEAGGNAEKAEELRQTASTVVATLVTPVAKGGAMGTRKTYKAEVTDKMALVKAVAAGQVGLDVLDVNESVLNKHAAALKESLKYPGVRVFEESSLARSRKAG